MLKIALLAAVLGLVLLFALGPVRRALITPRLLALFKRILPTMSDTERDALEAGTTWWDADLFSGRPDWSKLLGYGRVRSLPKSATFLITTSNACASWSTTGKRSRRKTCRHRPGHS